MRPRKQVDRFGSEILTSLILGESNGGDGFMSIPWVLQRYERVLRLRPAEAWLLYRLIGHAWKIGTPIFLSRTKLENECFVARKSLYTMFNSLERRGLIIDVKKWWELPENERPFFYVDPGRPAGRVLTYDVQPVYYALAVIIQCDPKSRANNGQNKFAYREDMNDKASMSIEEGKALLAGHGISGVNLDRLIKGDVSEATPILVENWPVTIVYRPEPCEYT